MNSVEEVLDEAAKSLLDEAKAGEPEGEDVRRSQLTMRQDEKEKKADEAEKNKKLKEEAAQEAAPKRRGRPRKASPTKADENECEKTEKGNAKKRQRKGAKSDDQDQKKTDGADAKPTTNRRKRAKSCKADADEEHAADGEEKNEEQKAAPKRKARRNASQNEQEQPADAPAGEEGGKKKRQRGKKLQSNGDDDKAAEKQEKKPKAKAKASTRRSRGDVEATGEVDHSLAEELIQIMTQLTGKPVDKDEIKAAYKGKRGKDIKTIIYWDRDAVGVAVRTPNGSMSQRFYFAGAYEARLHAVIVTSQQLFEYLSYYKLYIMCL